MHLTHCMGKYFFRINYFYKTIVTSKHIYIYIHMVDYKCKVHFLSLTNKKV